LLPTVRALTRGVWGGSSSRGRGTFFCFAKRKYPKKRRPEGRVLRCAADSLCFSSNAAAAELAPALRSGTQTVLADFPALDCDARRDLRELVRGGVSGCGCDWQGLYGAVKALGMGRGFVGRTSVRRAACRSPRLTDGRSTHIGLQALFLLACSLARRPIPERAVALPYD
jgi:hypothetical protein